MQDGNPCAYSAQQSRYYQKRYEAIEVETKKHIHDRFLIIDNKELYHIGASLKDLGKKWFAFSRIDSILAEIKKMLQIQDHLYQ